jgi:hypothetical protein
MASSRTTGRLYSELSTSIRTSKAAEQLQRLTADDETAACVASAGLFEGEPLRVPITRDTCDSSGSRACTETAEIRADLAQRCVMDVRFRAPPTRLARA